MLKFAGQMTFNHKSSGAWEDFKLQNQIGGEKRFGIKKEGLAFFYDAENNIVPSLFLYARKDLINYLKSSKYEFKHPSLNYAKKSLLPKMFDEKLAEVEKLDEYSALKFFIKSEPTRAYLQPTTAKNRERYNNFLKILLANNTQGGGQPYTCCTFLKFVDTQNKNIYIYMKPELTKEYTMEELAKIFSEEIEVNKVDGKIEERDCLPAISTEFAFKYRNQIKKTSDIDQLLRSVNNLNPKQKEKVKAAFLNIIDTEDAAWKQEVIEAKEAIERFAGIETTDESDDDDNNGNPEQKIYYGAPGTGKSHKIDDPVNGCGLKNVKNEYKFRTTFHPDYDYAQFVGAYKPRTIQANPETQANNVQGKNNQKKTEITYEFTPQVFAKAYVKAWSEFLIATAQDKTATGKNVYLVIEEINRGNCAQIFGDIFQLLDRECGHSAYPIDIDSDFATYIRERMSKVKLPDDRIDDYWDQYKHFIQKWAESNNGWADAPQSDEDFCTIALPPNLNILATMNTSDQSLFPMDSAFKRRFDWEYVPINDRHPDAHFAIKIDDKHYDWQDFLRKVNENIKNVNKSEDKQLGEFFIKPKDGCIIEIEEFRSKVLFYLWDSVYKDEAGNHDAEKVFHFKIKDGSDETMTFQKLFDRENGVRYVQMIMGEKCLDVKEYVSTENAPANNGKQNLDQGADEEAEGQP